ncbi:MAG: response regulator [Gammaproteobacteria bacterium]|nr:response regulator [Gammaproteobacteria bacterium]MCW8987789.1 response regulator [Gammaproteobacteria bacterium]MCW9030082.1 response regulator [Gammaproteobacteria bacterium]
MAELKKILYVEDEPDIQMIARVALENVGGFELLVCSSGAEAVEKAANFDPDLFLLDVMMPGMDGPTTLLELRKIPTLEKTPVIFMTAKVQPQEVEFLKSLNVTDVIAKPFDPMGLANNIRDSWSKMN